MKEYRISLHQRANYKEKERTKKKKKERANKKKGDEKEKKMIISPKKTILRILGRPFLRVQRSLSTPTLLPEEKSNLSPPTNEEEDT